MKVLDTSFIASFFLPNDSNHAKAEQMMGVEKETTLILPENILHETLTILNCRQDIALAKQAYLEMTQNTGIRIYHFTPNETQEVLDLFFSLGRKLSVPDASVIYLAKRQNTGVLTFDEEILRQIK